jgi:rhodanese-related sulfurtransferase
MRRTILGIALVVGMCQAAAVSLEQDTLKDYLKNGAPFDFVLIDVRSSEEITSAIGNENCKPYNLAWPVQFKDEVAKIPKDQAVIVYCRSGGRSKSAAAYLSESGYTRVYDAGGFINWTGPTVPYTEIKSASLLPESSMRAKAGK